MKINLLIKILYPKKVIENIKKKIALLGINNKVNIINNKANKTFSQKDRTRLPFENIICQKTSKICQIILN